MNRYAKIAAALLTMAFALAAASASPAADVRVGISARETYVGLPVIFRIQVANAIKVEPPTIPAVDGIAAKSMGNPSRSTQITSINGHTTTTTTQVFAFELTPERAGMFQIPAVDVNADGVTEHTRPLELVASKSETGDLMFVEIAGKEKQIYVGQALHLTLKIWLRPYNDAKNKITLTEGDMWKMISDRSEWGPFADRMQLYADQNRRPSGSEVLRKDHDGVEHSYYLYEIEATIYPKRPGKIDGNSVKVIANYPTSLGRARDPLAGFFNDMQLPGGRPPGFGDDDQFSLFGPRLVIQAVRPLAAQVNVEPIEVLPIPAAGRPADYRGAVGTYHIAVDASPTHVKAGDPINLFVGISGTGPMELVQAPPLGEIPDLNAAFKVPTEPLAGLVKGDRKIFSTTIRPRQAGVTQIPSIPFSYFDPVAARFVTAHSSPLSIHVDQADMLALDGQIPTTKDKLSTSPPSNPSSADSPLSSLSNFTGDELLVSESPWSPDWAAWFFLFAAPPIAVLVIVVARNRFLLVNLSHWFTSATAELQRKLTNAATRAEVAAALQRFAARNYNRSGAADDAESLLGLMREAGAGDLATRLETLLNECDHDIGPTERMPNGAAENLKRRALQWAADVETVHRRPVPKPNAPPTAAAKALPRAPRASTASSLVLAFAVMSVTLLATRSSIAEERSNPSPPPFANPTSIQLEEHQRMALLTEASIAYTNALEHLPHDPANAKSGFEEAAEKYQLLAGAGIENSGLYFDLANAYLESGETLKAIVNYHRSLRIKPTFHAAQINLAQAEQQLHASKENPEQQPPSDRTSPYTAQINYWLTRNITPQQILAAMALTWFVLWAVIACRVFGYRLPWKSAVLSLAVVTCLLGAALGQMRATSDQRLAIVVQPEAAASAGTQLDDGQAVEVLQQRPNAVRIRTAAGQEVWLPASAVDLI